VRVKLSLKCPVCKKAHLELIEREGKFVELYCARCALGYRVALHYVRRHYLRDGMLDWRRLVKDLYEGFHLNVALAKMRRIYRSSKSSNVLKHVR